MRFCVHMLWALMTVLSLASEAVAHQLQVEPVVMVLRPQNTFLSAELSGNGEDIIQAIQVRDDERVGHEEFVPAVSQRLQKYFNQQLRLEQSGRRLPATLTVLEYWRPDDLDYKRSKFRVVLHYPREAKLAKGQFHISNGLFDYLPNATMVLSVGGIQKTIKAGQTLDFDPADVRGNLMRNVRDFIALGAEHIFLGPDHMLFILALLLTANSFWSLAKTLTGFTVAHSITLMLSALSIVVLPERLTNIMIALSIVYVGLENIYWKDAQKHRFWVAAIFGLVHGFGFSGVLREIGLPDEGLAWCLLSFNLGVEIAQMVVCAAAFPLLLMARRKFDHQEQYGGMPWSQVVRILSIGVVLAGGFWLLERVTGG